MENKLSYYKSLLSDKDFNKISEFVETNYGIRLPRTKKAMVQNRLYKRLISTKISSFDDYVKFVFSPQGKQEIALMIDEITTNKTDFFRENKHYIYLENEILKQSHNLNIWSAGCSTGEEPYTIAMLANNNNVNCKISATDLSGRVLKIAEKGIYAEQVTKDIPELLLKKYFDKLLIDNKTFFKIKDVLRNNVKFCKVNFIDRNYNVPNDFDIIFFRNVLIYFNLEVQNMILEHILKHLRTGGYLFIGHAEAIYNKKLPLKSLAPSVYQKK